MLKKLLKYEFMATARTYSLPYLVLMVSSLGLGVWLGADAVRRIGDGVELGLLLSVLYMAAIIALAIVTIYTIVQRFYRNLLGREGYLMHTLPVTSGQLIASKLIAAMTWSVCSVIAGCASIFIICLGLVISEGISIIELSRAIAGKDWQQLMWSFQDSLGMSIGQFLMAAALISLAAGVCLILCIYAACMVGHQAKKHTILAGIGVYFAFSWAQNLVMNLVMNAGTFAGLAFAQQAEGVDAAVTLGQSAMSGTIYWGSVLSYVAMYLAFAALYFVGTMYLMNNRLNLE